MAFKTAMISSTWVRFLYGRAKRSCETEKAMTATAASTTKRTKKICILQYNNVKLPHVKSRYNPEAKIKLLLKDKTANIVRSSGRSSLVPGLAGQFLIFKQIIFCFVLFCFVCLLFLFFSKKK